MALALGNVEVPIFARFNGKDIQLGSVTVPIKLNASAVIREAQSAMTGDDTNGGMTGDPETMPLAPDPETTTTAPEAPTPPAGGPAGKPVKDDAASLAARVQATAKP